MVAIVINVKKKYLLYINQKKKKTWSGLNLPSCQIHVITIKLYTIGSFTVLKRLQFTLTEVLLLDEGCIFRLFYHCNESIIYIEVVIHIGTLFVVFTKFCNNHIVYRIQLIINIKCNLKYLYKLKHVFRQLTKKLFYDLDDFMQLFRDRGSD